jgi:ectoine hydroxylase-related dioxygenase (phytanoyl-CoA dioxygenase family)
MQMTAAAEPDRMQKSLDADMANHQSEMEALANRLEASYHAIADARDAKGYVRDKATLNAHEATIKKFREALREWKRSARNYEHQCGLTREHEDAVAEHQKQMKRVFHDVLDSFETLEYTNEAHYDPNYEAIVPIGDAFNEHRAALKRLSDAIQHQQAMEPIMRKCS